MTRANGLLSSGMHPVLPINTNGFLSPDMCPMSL